MFEMSESCGDHSHSVGVTPVNTILIPDRASRMYYSDDTSLSCYFNTVREREKGIRSHYRTVEVKSKGFSLDYCLFESIYSGCLSDAACQKHGVFGEHYGVGLGMFYQFVGKKQILHLFSRRGENGHSFEFFGTFYLFVPILDENATQQ